MSQGEQIITIVLAVIAYFLYQIARQLTFLTGRRMRFPFSNLFGKHSFRQKYKPEPKEEKLPN